MLILHRYGLGLFLAAQVGPVTLLIVRSGHLLNGGSARLWFGLASAAVLIVIGARTFRIGWRARFGLETPDEVVGPSRAFLTAVAATALNPLTIALWTVSFPAAAPSSATHSASSAGAVLIGVGLGTFTWYGGFSAGIGLFRKRVGNRLLRFIDIGAGVGLIGFGGLLGYRVIHEA